MADLMTLDDMADGKLDLKTIAIYTSGDENVVNEPRLAPGVNVGSLAALNKHVKDKVDLQIATIPSGHKGYPTLAAAQAAQASLPVNTLVEVTNDTTTANNGVYLWDGTTLTKSTYDVLGQAKAYTDTNIAKIATAHSKNLFDATKAVNDKRLNASTGAIETAVGAKITGMIPVVAGQTYTISWSNAVETRPYFAFFTNATDTNPVAFNNTASQTSPVTFTAPANANFVVVTLKQASTLAERQNFQLEKGSNATAYTAYEDKQYKAKSDFVADALVDYATKSDLVNTTKKNYETTITSKNLFDTSKVVNNSRLNSTNGNIEQVNGWGRSGMIPVVAGQTYTLSGQRSRVGLSWFANATDTTAISYNGTGTLPFSITSPANANFVSFNLYTDTATTYSNIQFEQGSTATAYEPYGSKTIIDSSNVVNLSAKSKLKIISNFAYLTAISDITVELQLRLSNTNTHSQSMLFNFIDDKINGSVVRGLSDDVAPTRIDNTTVGANHGYNKTDITTSAAHGKTNADVGSVWTDGSKEWVIVDVPSTTVVSVTARTDNAAFSGSSLTHVSGATNAGAITVSSLVTNQWFQPTRDRQLNVFVDDVLIDTAVNKEYEYKDTIRFAESYSIMKKTDIVEWLIVNKGQNPSIYLADKAYTVAFIYEFDTEGGCVIYFSGVGRKSIAMQDQMITQSVKLNSGNGTVYYYVPKTKPFNTGGYSYNFALKEPVESKNPSSPIYFNTSNTDSGLTVDRIIQLNDKVGYATGYLPIFDAELSKRLVNASRIYLEIRNGTLKNYPRLIDRADKTTIEQNDTFAAIAYRKYFKLPSNRTAKYVVRSSQGKYLYLDWHNTALTDEINLPSDLQGKQYTVVEKSDNVTVLNQFVGDKLLVNVSASGGYAYLVVKF